MASHFSRREGSNFYSSQTCKAASGGSSSQNTAKCLRLQEKIDQLQRVHEEELCKVREDLTLEIQRNMDMMMQRMQAMESHFVLHNEEPSRPRHPHPDYDDENDDQDVIDRPTVQASRRRRS